MNWNWALIALLALAASRVVHLVADDTFPFGYARYWLEQRQATFAHWLASGMSCTFCCSVYAGAAAAGLAQWQGWAPSGLWVFMVLWFALAQAIILIEGVIMALMGDD